MWNWVLSNGISCAWLTARASSNGGTLFKNWANGCFKFKKSSSCSTERKVSSLPKKWVMNYWKRRSLKTSGLNMPPPIPTSAISKRKLKSSVTKHWTYSILSSKIPKPNYWSGSCGVFHFVAKSWSGAFRTLQLNRQAVSGFLASSCSRTKHSRGQTRVTCPSRRHIRNNRESVRAIYWKTPNIPVVVGHTNSVSILRSSLVQFRRPKIRSETMECG